MTVAPVIGVVHRHDDAIAARRAQAFGEDRRRERRRVAQHVAHVVVTKDEDARVSVGVLTQHGRRSSPVGQCRVWVAGVPRDPEEQSPRGNQRRQPRLGGVGPGAHGAQPFSDASRLSTVPFGLTLYQASATLPFSSIRNAERTMPKYFLPYMLFSPHTPYASATAWSSSASSGKPSPYFVSNFCWRAGGSGLIPSTAVSPMSPATSRKPHACVVQPGVSAFG